MYDPLQIFLHETCSHEIGALVCGLVLTGAELSCYAARILFELPSTATSLSWKPVPPSPPWFSHDASVLITRLPPWRD